MAVSRSSGRLSAPVISPSSTSVANGNGSSAKLAAMSPKVLREAFWLANGHKVRLMRVAAAIVIAGALIAIAVLIAFRWQISAATGVVYRLDRWTGHAVLAVPMIGGMVSSTVAVRVSRRLFQARCARNPPCR
jgi:hypothetical protein